MSHVCFGQASGQCISLIDILFEVDFNKVCYITFHKLYESPRRVGIVNPSEVLIQKLTSSEILWDPKKKPRKPRSKRPKDDNQEAEFGLDADQPVGNPEAMPLEDGPAWEEELQAADEADEAAFAAAALQEESDWDGQFNQLMDLALAAGVEEGPVMDEEFEVPDVPVPAEPDHVEDLFLLFGRLADHFD